MTALAPNGRCLVTGASGFIGGRLVHALREHDATVRAVTRRAAPSFPHGVEVTRADLADPNAELDAAVADCDVVFHCAGEVNDPSAMRAVHVDGTRRLLAAAERAAQKRGAPLHWVQLSSVGAYGPAAHPGEDRVVTEKTPPRPIGEYERTKTRGDDAVNEAAARALVTASILRPSNVYGHTMPNGSVRALASMVRRGLFFYVGERGAIATYVHVDDVVDALLRVATDVRAHGETFNLSNDCELHAVIDAFADAQQVRRPSLRLPATPVMLAATLASSLGVRVLTPQRVAALTSRTRYPVDKLRDVLGFTPMRDVPATIVEVIRPA